MDSCYTTNLPGSSCLGCNLLVKIVKHYRKSFTAILLRQNKNWGILFSTTVKSMIMGEKRERKIQFQSLPTSHISTLVKRNEGYRELKSNENFPLKSPVWVNSRLFHSHRNLLPSLHVPDALHYMLKLVKLIPYPWLHCFFLQLKYFISSLCMAVFLFSIMSSHPRLLLS